MRAIHCLFTIISSWPFADGWDKYMQARWVLSQFYVDSGLAMSRPICGAYGGRFLYAAAPAIADGWALVQILCSPQQLEAAKQDPRIIVLPLVFDPSPLPQKVIDSYADRGAVAGMSLAALLAHLAETDPVYGHSLP